MCAHPLLPPLLLSSLSPLLLFSRALVRSALMLLLWRDTLALRGGRVGRGSSAHIPLPPRRALPHHTQPPFKQSPLPPSLTEKLPAHQWPSSLLSPPPHTPPNL